MPPDFIDNHAHSLLRNNMQLDLHGFRKCWTESRCDEIIDVHVPAQWSYMDMLEKLGELLGVSGEEAIIAKRSTFKEQEYVRLLWSDANIKELVVDNGFGGGAMYSLEELEKISGRAIHECRRIESVLEHCLNVSDSFADLQERFAKTLFQPIPQQPVALKTIMAYRGGLELMPVTTSQAESDYRTSSKQIRDRNGRIEKCALYHYMLMQAFEMAASHGIPVQVHTGIGDDDASLLGSNPALLQPLFKLTTLRHTRWLLLHCYPYVREAAFLCSLYSNVYMDLSLAVNLVSPSAPQIVHEAYAGAPATKIVTATDGHSIPETHWYAAHCWNQAVAKLPAELIKQAQQVHRLPTEAGHAAD